MRDLKEYSFSEYLCGIPFLHAFKDARNNILQRSFVAKGCEKLDVFLEKTQKYRDQNVAASVAFNQPWVIDWQLGMIARYVKGVAWMIFDNSSDAKARREIEAVCEKYKVDYLSLPKNPERHPCRSHGIALSWIYENVILKIEPENFAFIDHDIIPMESIDFAIVLKGQPFYGYPNTSLWGWNLWAGYCFYNYSAVKGFKLNFNNNRPRELDTGGRNWERLYRHFDYSQMRMADITEIELIYPEKKGSHSMSLIDHQWIHLQGAGYQHNYATMLEFYKGLAQATNEGAILSDFVLQ